MAATQWVADFVQWYNYQHRHSGIQFVTPEQRHTGVDREILIKRHATYQAAKAKNPARWAQGTRNWKWQPEVHLNPDKPNACVTEKRSNSVH